MVKLTRSILFGLFITSTIPLAWCSDPEHMNDQVRPLVSEITLSPAVEGTTILDRLGPNAHDIFPYLFQCFDDLEDVYNLARSAKAFYAQYEKNSKFQGSVRVYFVNSRNAFLYDLRGSLNDWPIGKRINDDIACILGLDTFVGYSEFVKENGSLLKLYLSKKMWGFLAKFYDALVPHPKDGILRCGNYKLRTLSEHFSYVNWAEVLVLNGNYLDDPLWEIKGLNKSLRKLHLANNRFTVVPTVIHSFEKLTFLDLCFNQLESFPDISLTLKNLETLWLYGNQLTSFPTGLVELKKLQDLNVSRNQIAVIPDSITTMALTSFYCEENPLTLTDAQQEWQKKMRERKEDLDGL